MAHASLNIPLWDSRNTEEETIVSLCPKFENLLNSKRVQLTKKVKPAPLWPYLRQYNVVTKADRDRIQLGSIDEDQVDKLIDYLERNPCWRLHAFLKACRDTGQEHVIRLLGLDPETYSDSEPSPDLSESSARETTTQGFTGCQLMKGLQMHADSYRRRLLRGNLFDFKHRTSYATFPITECYIEQDLKLPRGKKMAVKDALKRLGNGPRPQTVLLSGPPGAGKTTILNAMAHQWSQERSNYMENPNNNPKPEHTIVVCAPAMNIKGGIWDSIKREVCGRDEKSKGDVIQHLRQDHSSAILLDALDEIRDSESLSNLEKFIENNHVHGGPQLLVSARTGLSRLKNELFDRSLQLEGFTLEQGLQYIESFFGSELHQIYVTTEGSKRMNLFQPEEILNYVRENKENMKAILCNPLRVHILCGLAAQGVLKLEEDNTFKPLYLFKCHEEYFIKREKKGDQVSEQERHNFYRMCLHGLLTNIRDFTEKDFDKFKVCPDSPYKAFFIENNRLDESANEVVFLSFVHETFYEFFAARCIEVLPDDYKKAVILSACSEDILQNVRVMICQVLSQYETKDTLTLATGMIKIMLCFGIYASIDRQDIKEDIKTNIPALADLLLQQSGFDDKNFLSKVNYVWEMVDSQFTSLKDTSRKYWKEALFSSSLAEIQESVNEFSKKQQFDMINSSIHKLLPLEKLSDGQYTCVYPAGHLGWTIVDQSKEAVHVLGLCLSDCVEALLKHQTRQPYTPNTTKPETNGIRHLTIKVPSNMAWSELIDQTFIPSDMIESLTAYKDIEKITIDLGLIHKPCIDMLDHLVTLGGQCPEIVILYGTVSLEDFHRWWCESGHKYQGRITLEDLTVRLPADGECRDRLLQWVREAVSEDLAEEMKAGRGIHWGSVHLGDRITLTWIRWN